MASNGTSPKITLYTNHGCPWAHRAHIALAELGLEYDEKIIDLSVPREPSYLAINPRGLVPTLIYNGETIPESGIVAQFLADAHPSHLVKGSTERGGALQRAKYSFFIDALVSKVNPQIYAGQLAADETIKAEAGVKLVDAVVKELEPLLADAAPFFGGSSKLTLVEVQTGSFLLRILEFPRYGILSPKITEDLKARAPSFYKWGSAVIAEKSVNYIWNADDVAARTKARLAKLAAEKI